MTDEKRMENLPEEVRESKREPLTVHDKIYIMLLWLVTTLWVALLIRIGGWITEWIRSLF